MLKTKLYKKKVQILEKSSFWPLTVEFITELEKMAHFQVALNDLYIQVWLYLLTLYLYQTNIWK